MSIYLYPHGTALSGKPYLVPFEIRNESLITFNMVSLRFNGHSLTIDEPGDITEAPKGTDYVFDTVAEIKDVPMLMDGDSVTVRELFPGESLLGIYQTIFDVYTSPYDVYNVLRESIVRSQDDETGSIPVIIEPILEDDAYENGLAGWVKVNGKTFFVDAARMPKKHPCNHSYEVP